MKSATDLLHRTPWWVLIFGALATFAALAIFVTPYHIIQYRERGEDPEQSRAIKREIDNTFAENAINLGRGVLRGMIARTSDPKRREELEQALQGLEEAREELRHAGAELLGAKREALEGARKGLDGARDAVRNLKDSLRDLNREASNAKGEARAELRQRVKELEATLRHAQSEERRASAMVREAERALRRSEKGVRIDLGPNISIERGGATPAPADAPKPPELPSPPDIPSPHPEGATPPTPDAASPPTPPPPSLSPEVATKIRRDVTGDMYRIGIGAGLILILVPLFIVAVVVKFFADRSRASLKVAEAKRREAEYHRMSQQVTEAKLAALQAQVEPHFLYNTLASVQALTEVDPAKASEMTGHLIQYLRNALPKMRDSVSTVGQEVELARAYLNILQMRMGKRLAFEIDVPPELLEAPFPPLMLPSLVENSIKHGLEPQREGGLVRISVTREGEKLRLVVADTGRGFSETPGAGVGLANIRERLAALYGDAAHLTLEANDPQGVVATLEVPAAGTRSQESRAAGASAAAASATMPPPIPSDAAAMPPPIPPEAGAMPPPIPPLASAAAAASATPKIAKIGFWPRTWEALVATERVWRIALYYLYLALLVVTGVAILAAIVAYGFGEFPVQFGDQIIVGPAGALIVLGGGVIGFVAAAAALALVMLVLYAIGYLLLVIILIVVLAVLIGVFPAAAPFILIGLFVWWLVKRNQAAKATPVPRVEPTVSGGPGAGS